MLNWSKKTSPAVDLPTRIDAAGTASQTISGGTVKAFVVRAESASSQLRVTINGSTFDFLIGDGWELKSPDGSNFVNDVLLTALSGTFVISTIK